MLQKEHSAILLTFIKVPFVIKTFFLYFLQIMSIFAYCVTKGALAIRRIFSLVDMITKPKFSNGPNVFKIGLFR